MLSFLVKNKRTKKNNWHELSFLARKEMRFCRKFLGIIWFIFNENCLGNSRLREIKNIRKKKTKQKTANIFRLVITEWREKPGNRVRILRKTTRYDETLRWFYLIRFFSFLDKSCNSSSGLTVNWYRLLNLSRAHVNVVNK